MKSVKPLKEYILLRKRLAECRLERIKGKGDELSEAVDVDEILNCEDILEILEAYGNGSLLHSEQKRCPACNKMFMPKNNLQECCDTKCRVRLHRAKNRLKEFNAKANEILKVKDPEAKFTVEQIITSQDKCPFIVNYKGKEYQSDNTRNLLTQLKKI
ncbi:MAG: hypothetical protein COC06_07665 [Bacteroidales bacterium]|nr:MAG: hypothetical protein COC06_07665 [Bacteroidales bacterium]